MADTELDIIVRGDSKGAVAAMDSTARGLDNLGGRMGDMSNQFKKPLEHVGIHVFGQELLRMVGISGEARAFIHLLEVGIKSLGASFTFLTGPVGMAVAVLAASAAVVYKVVQGQKDLAKELGEARNKTEQSLKSHQSLLDKFKEYETKVGPLTASMKRLRDATVNLMEAERAHAEFVATRESVVLNKQIADIVRQEKGIRAAIVATNDEKKSLIEHLASLASTSALYGDSAKKLDELNLKEKDLRSELEMVNAGFDAYKVKQGGAVAAMDSGIKAADEEKKKIEESAAKWEKWANAKITAINKSREAMHRAWKEEDAAMAKADAKDRQVFGAMATQAEGFASAAGSAFGGLASNVGSSMARMIVYGEKWKESFADIMKSVVATFIQAVIEMEIRWLAFMAVKGIAGAFSGGIGSVPMVPAASSGYSFGGGMQGALGLDEYVDRPTMFLAGEAGRPERVSISPLGGGASDKGGGTAGGGGGNTYNIGPFIAQGVDDPAEFGRSVMNYIMQQIRGRGQIKAVGPGLY
jgi:hypothetical protein